MVKMVARSAALFAIAIVLNACGGSTHAASVPAGSSGQSGSKSSVRITIAYPRVPAAARRRTAQFVDAANTSSISLAVMTGFTAAVPAQTLTPVCSAGVCSASTTVQLAAGSYTFIVKALDAATPPHVLSSASIVKSIANGPASLSLELGGFPNGVSTHATVGAQAAGADLGTSGAIVSGTTAAGAAGVTTTAIVAFGFTDAGGVAITGNAPFSPDFTASGGPVQVTAYELDPLGDVTLGAPPGSGATCTANTCTLSAPSDTLSVTLPATIDPGTGTVAFPHDVVLKTQFMNSGVAGGSPSVVDSFELRTTCTAASPACVHMRPQGLVSTALSTASIAAGPGNIWLGAPPVSGNFTSYAVLDETAEAAASDSAWTVQQVLLLLGSPVPGLLAFENLAGTGNVVWGTDITHNTAGAGGPGSLDAYDGTYNLLAPPSLSYATGSLPAFNPQPNGGEGSVTIDAYGNVWAVDPSSYALIAYDPYTANPAPPGGLPPNPLTPGASYRCSPTSSGTPIGASLLAADATSARVWFTATDGMHAYAGFATAADISGNPNCNVDARTKRLATTGVPQGLAVDGSGAAWYDDVANVGELTAAGSPATITVQPEAALPGIYRDAFGIAYDRKDGYLYLTDSHGLLGRFNPAAGASSPASTLSLPLPPSIAATIAAHRPSSSGSHAPFGFVGFQTGAPVPDPAGRIWILAMDAAAGPLNMSAGLPVDAAVALSLDPAQLAGRFGATAVAPAAIRRRGASSVRR